MEKAGVKKTVILMILGLLINYTGKAIAIGLSLPLWLDSIGTGITAGLLGPFYGALCGLTSNLIYSLTDITQVVFAFTNIAIGLIVGYSVRQGVLNHFFGVFYLSAGITVLTTGVSTILSCVFWKGFTGNIWGNAVVEMLEAKLGWNIVNCSVIGQLYVEVPDKFLMILCVYYVLKLDRMKKIKKDAKIVSAVLIAMILTGAFHPLTASAEEEEKKDVTYSSLYSMSVFSNDNGLSAGEANAIVQTKDGYIWVGTYAGLYRYDGVRFELENEIDSVKNVNCLYVDEPGRLWIGTNDSGITLLVKGKVNTVLDMNDGLASNSIRCITADSDGNYYIGTSYGMCVCSLDNGLKIIKNFDSINYAKNISIGPDGTVAVINNEGKLFMIKDLEIQGVYSASAEGTYYASGTFLRNGECLLADSKNNFYRWDFEKEEPAAEKMLTTAKLQNVTSIWEDEQKDDYIWVCFDNGIGYFENDDFYILETGSFNSSIDHGITDYQGNIWFTSSRLGLLKLSRNTFANIYQEVGLPSVVVNAVTYWNGLLYSGTDAGLNIINLTDNTYVENDLTNHLKGNRIRNLLTDTDNHLWICVTDGDGLLEVTPDGKITHYNTETGTLDNRFRSIIELANGGFAVAENTGISFIENGKVTATISSEDGLTCPQILSLCEREDGSILAGSDGNGIFIIKDKKVAGQITREDGLSSDVVMRITSCREGYFIVTANGLCFMKNNGEVKVLDQFPYFNNYDVLCMEDDKVWVLGSAGFFIVNKEELIENGDMNYEQLERKSGFMSKLTANSWSYVDDLGNAYFCCSDGVYSINTIKYNSLKSSCRMKVEKIKIDDVEYLPNQNKNIVVTGSMNRLEIDPVIFNFTLSNPYVRYYLEGFEDRKTVVKQSDLSTITYTNIPSGEYVFHMELLDSMQNKVLENCTYTIIKKKAFWENWWFYVYFYTTGILIVVFITYIIVKSRSNAIIEKQKREIEFAKEQARMGDETILAIARTVDAKDDNTSQHSERVAQYSVLIAKRLGWSNDRVEAIRKVALLHDIGKIGIPDAVLKKTDRLTDEEYKIMKSHVVIGADILKDFSLVENVAEGARYHHERYDGKGYVMGLKGDEIPINARIIGVADAFDAMTSNRVYRKRLDPAFVIKEMKDQKGKQFDPEIVDILLKLIEDGEIVMKPKEE